MKTFWKILFVGTIFFGGIFVGRLYFSIENEESNGISNSDTKVTLQNYYSYTNDAYGFWFKYNGREQIKEGEIKVGDVLQKVEIVFLDNKWQRIYIHIKEGKFRDKNIDSLDKIHIEDPFLKPDGEGLKPDSLHSYKIVGDNEEEHTVYVQLPQNNYLEFTYDIAPGIDQARVEGMIQSIGVFSIYGEVSIQHDKVSYSIEDRGLSFLYPKEWGQVRDDVENKGFDLGKVVSIFFTNTQLRISFFSDEYALGIGEGFSHYFDSAIQNNMSIKEVEQLLKKAYLPVDSIEKITIAGVEGFEILGDRGQIHRTKHISYILPDAHPSVAANNIMVSFPVDGKDYSDELEALLYSALRE